MLGSHDLAHLGSRPNTPMVIGYSSPLGRRHHRRIGAAGGQRDEPGLDWREPGKAEASSQIGSITRLGYASAALARGDLWQGKAESIGQPASPGLRQHR
jgi:hypothetical protein